jgi:hypothetical protein
LNFSPIDINSLKAGNGRDGRDDKDSDDYVKMVGGGREWGRGIETRDLDF